MPTTTPPDKVAVTTADDATLLLPASWISTTGWVVKGWEYLAPVAVVVSTILVGAPTVTEKFDDVVCARPDDENDNV